MISRPSLIRMSEKIVTVDKMVTILFRQVLHANFFKSLVCSTFLFKPQFLSYYVFFTACSVDANCRKCVHLADSGQERCIECNTNFFVAPDATTCTANNDGKLEF